MGCKTGMHPEWELTFDQIDVLFNLKIQTVMENVASTEISLAIISMSDVSRVL